MENEINELTQLILKSEVEIQAKNQELAKRSKLLQEIIDARDTLNKQVEDAKKKLKTLIPEGKIEKELNGNTLSVSVWKTLRVTETNLEEIPEEYITEEEVFNIVEREGKYYQRTGNTKLVKNLIQAGMDCPEGFATKETKAISIKFNGNPL